MFIDLHWLLIREPWDLILWLWKVWFVQQTCDIFSINVSKTVNRHILQPMVHELWSENCGRNKRLITFRQQSEFQLFLFSFSDKKQTLTLNTSVLVRKSSSDSFLLIHKSVKWVFGFIYFFLSSLHKALTPRTTKRRLTKSWRRARPISVTSMDLIKAWSGKLQINF